MNENSDLMGAVADPEKLDVELRVKVTKTWKTFLEGRQTSTKNVSDLVREALEAHYPNINEPEAEYGSKHKKR